MAEKDTSFVFRMSFFRCDLLHSYFECRFSNAIRFIRISNFVSQMRLALFVFLFSKAIRVFKCHSFFVRFALFVFRIFLKSHSRFQMPFVFRFSNAISIIRISNFFSRKRFAFSNAIRFSFLKCDSHHSYFKFCFSKAIRFYRLKCFIVFRFWLSNAIPLRSYRFSNAIRHLRAHVGTCCNAHAYILSSYCAFTLSTCSAAVCH